MEKFDVSELRPGEKLLVKTETGSVYHLEAETVPERLSEVANLFKGFMATRESEHHIEGRPEMIERERVLLIIRSGRTDGVLQTGDFIELVWDRDHPDSRDSWDIQFGPKFHPLYTSDVVDIEFVPVEE